MPGTFYHIYNRGNNRENIFIEKKNCDYFLDKYFLHTNKVVDTAAYCLLKNHFHLLVRIKEENEIKQIKGLENKITENIYEFVSQQFSNFFNSYTKSVNKKYNRTGSLFNKPFRRKIVESDNYLNQVIAYIHLNPENHKFIDNFRDYPYSSYHEILSSENNRLKKNLALDCFGSKENYIAFHDNYRDFSAMKNLIIED